MKTISFINIKGGVAKTTSAIAFATLLAYEHNKRVLLLDCDKQGNATTALIKSTEISGLTTADLLLDKSADIHDAIISTEYGIDLIPADFNLLEANRKVLFETTSRELRLKKQLEQISEEYDFCIIDCPPDVNIGVTNALAASDYVLIPIRADSYGFNGLNYTFDAVQEAQEINPNLKIAGCFLTMLQSNTLLAIAARASLSQVGEYEMSSYIRNSTKVGESTFTDPLIISSPRSTVAEDYRALLKEFLERIKYNG